MTSLIPALSCRSCRPNAPFAELMRLSRTSITDETRQAYTRRTLGQAWCIETLRFTMMLADKRRMRTGPVNGKADFRPHRTQALGAWFRLRWGRRTDGAWRSARPGANHRPGNRCRCELFRHRGAIRQRGIRKKSWPHPAKAETARRGRRQTSDRPKRINGSSF
jgi:hypothetical protein